MDINCKCVDCGSPATKRMTHHGPYCTQCYRIWQMRSACQKDHKPCPTKTQLRQMFAGLIGRDMKCESCSSTMNWLASDGRRTVVSLQHDRSGGMRLICLSCNTRHRACPGDSFYEIPDSHRRCGRCEQALPKDQFGVHRGSSTGLHHYCRKCAAEKARKWTQDNYETFRPRATAYERERLRRRKNENT